MATGSRIKTVCASNTCQGEIPVGALPPSPIAGQHFGRGDRRPRKPLAKASASDRRAHLQRGSGALAAYEIRRCGARGFFSLSREYQLQIIRRIQQRVRQLSGLPLSPMRTPARSYGATSTWGGLVRKVRTSVGWIFDQNDVLCQPAILTQFCQGSRLAGRPAADGGAPPRPM